MPDLTKRSNRFFKGLCNEKLITEKELKYFSFSFKSARCLGIIYLLPKIHKRLFDVPGRPIISNCGTPTETLLDHHRQPVVKGGSFYVKHTQDFLEKLKHLGKCHLMLSESIWPKTIDNLVTDQHILTLRSLIKNLCLTLLKEVTEFLRDCAIRNLSQKKS